MHGTDGSGMAGRESSELWTWDATEIVAAVTRRDVSCAEVVQSCLDRLDRVNPAVNAVIAHFPTEAIAAAKLADAAAARGEVLGPLHGVPVTVKDNVDQQAAATTNGVVAWRALISDEDSPAVAGLRAAGAIVIGRTNTSSMSLRWTSENDLHGLTLNPWVPDRTAGGSSGGAGVAVATGVGPIAHANDLFGSIRYPAFCSGVTGLRPSWGVTPFFNGTSTAERGLAFQTMAVQGPITRSVRDLAPAMTAMWGHDPRDPWTVPVPFDASPGMKPAKVAVSLDPVGAGVHPAIKDALRRAAVLLADAGYVVEEIDPPHTLEAAELAEDIIITETRVLSAAAVEEFADAPMRRQLELTLARRKPLDLNDYVRALARRATLRRSWALFSEKYPVLLCPNSAQLPYRLGEDIASQAALDQIYLAHALFFVVPLVGAPALALPTGCFDGVPIGIQLIGRRFGEAALIQAGGILEAGFGVTTPIDPVYPEKQV
ncbi:MAG: amidase [Mesorhizobium sp.]